MLIFLDFDGVLHAHGELPFERVDLLEAFVLARPGVEVVISSSWRETLSLKVLRDLFSESFAERILGVTPVFPSTGHPQATLAGDPGVRQREIEAYVAQHHPGRPWVALDDLPELFSGTDRLIHVPRGLDAEVLARLEARLQATPSTPAG